MELSIVINTENRIEITQSLSELLADTYILYTKTQNDHWNVTGIYFKYLHELFEEHYTEMAQAIDEIAERIRALGEYAPGSYQQFSQLSTIKETTTIPNWKEMLTNLLQDHEQVVNGKNYIKTSFKI